MSPSRPLIGVLGGMGPAATADFYAKLVAVVGAPQDQAHPPVVIWGDPSVPDRVSSVLDGTDAAYPVMLEGARRLALVGATFVAMPCNTAHHWLDRLAADSGVPFLDMVDEAVVAALGPDGPLPTAVLGTAGTIGSGLYQRRWAVRAGDGAPPLVCPTDVQQPVLAEEIARGKGGDVAGGRALLEVVVEQVRAAGAERVILACTELPVAWGSRPDEPGVVDATESLAAATWREYRRQVDAVSSAESSSDG